MEVTRTFASGLFDHRDCHKLQAEIAADATAIGATCTRVRFEQGDPDDSLIYQFAIAPNEVALDAAIAAYPSTATPISGSTVIAANTDYTLTDEPIEIGECAVFDFFFFAVMGDATNCQPQIAQGTFVAWRRTADNVFVALTPVASGGDIPSFQVRASGTATTARLLTRMSKPGTIQIVTSQVTRNKSTVIS